MKGIISLFFLFYISWSTYASIENDMVAKYQLGVTHYEARNYREALNDFQGIINSGYESNVLYYNLGNAAFRLNKFSFAIWCYNKALIIDPLFIDAKYNLNVAQQKLPNIIEPTPLPWHKNVIDQINKLLSTDGWAICTLIGLCMLVASIIIFLLSTAVYYRKLLFWISALLLLLNIFIISISLRTYYSSINPEKAIIIVPAIGVKSEPNAQAVDIFTIHEGNIVTISDRAGDWIEIESPNGESGWVAGIALMVL